MTKNDRIKGGLFGLLIGDALGVPYEFHDSNEIPVKDRIEYSPPPGFLRSHVGVSPGTWSDDGAQALCLLDSLLECGNFDVDNFAGKLLCWYNKGVWAIDNIVFDIGIQTSRALNEYSMGVSPLKSGFINPEGKGNGSLMRVLPLALWHNGTDDELVKDSHMQSLVTHGHLCNQVCCALYCLYTRYLVNGKSLENAYKHAVKNLREIYENYPEYKEELEWSFRPDEPLYGNGGGYVVDCLKSALIAVMNTKSYEEVVKYAISFGDDTDTTAAVAGGIAGVYYGFDNIPSRWYLELRGKENVQELMKKLLEYIDNQG